MEPLSVTPFTEIALDKVLASLLVCFVRHKQGLYPDKRAKDFTGNYKELEVFISERIKNKKQLDKKYVDELKDEYDRIGEIRANRLTAGCLVTVVLVLSLVALNFGLIIIK